MGTDAEGLAIHALSKALSIRLRIVYLHRDRDLGYYSYPVDNDEPCHVHLLLSPTLDKLVRKYFQQLVSIRIFLFESQTSTVGVS
jgi:hypothetical protein